VILAFLMTAAITLAASIVGQFLALVNDEKTENPIDKRFRRTISNRLPAVSSSHRLFWSTVIKNFVLGLSDQQLVTGIAILMVGFIRLSASQGQIRVYHMAIVVDLAWFSSSTHFAALDILGDDYLDCHATLRIIRAFGMFAMFVGLTAASILQGHQWWYESFNCPAACIALSLEGNIDGPSAFWMAVNLVFLVPGYGGALWDMLRPSRSLPEQRQGSGLTDRGYRRVTPRPMAAIRGVSERIYLVVMGVWSVVVCMWGSQVLGLLGNIVWFSLGVWNLVGDRNLGQAQMQESENVWGFGQVIPVFLLILPVLTGLDIYYGIQ
jgi:hypothetical protein